MGQKIKIVYYLYEVKDEPLGDYAKAVESKLGRFVRLVNPDEYTLMTNFKSILGTSKEAHVIEIRNDISRWLYLTKGVNDLETPKAAYEYEIGKEEALEAVFREIAEGSPAVGRKRVMVWNSKRRLEASSPAGWTERGAPTRALDARFSQTAHGPWRGPSDPWG